MIVVITSPDCPLCAQLTRALTEHDVVYQHREADSLNAPEHAMLTADAEGDVSLPVLLTESGAQFRGSAALSYVDGLRP